MKIYTYGKMRRYCKRCNKLFYYKTKFNKVCEKCVSEVWKKRKSQRKDTSIRKEFKEYKGINIKHHDNRKTQINVRFNTRDELMRIKREYKLKNIDYVLNILISALEKNGSENGRL